MLWILQPWPDSHNRRNPPGIALRQDDLFGTAPTPVADGPSAEVLAMVRKQLHTTLALVKAAPAMPWTDMLTIIREDNAFLYGKNLLPEAEGAALWAEFDVEMDRLYAIMNEGMELDPDT